jgi:tetratricopeptide (TPR) repeat protein/tRNA A-37 threonylcarbamoyl transferase component Bud32
MTPDERIVDLLLRWEELRAQGRSVTPAELCGDCPELREEVEGRIRGLQELEPLFGHLRENAAPRSATAPAVWTAPDLRYRPVRFHAKGGLGEVHVAQDQELHRDVALKRIQPAHSHDEDSRRRFLREAMITGRLEHPGIVPVHGLVHDGNGEPCYAMRLIQGETLQEAIWRFHEADRPGCAPGERSLALRQLLGRFVAVCNTLAYAHSRGVVHRDLKPDNIMLGPYGETLVVDWGLAKPFAVAQTDETTLPRPAPAGEEPGTELGTVVGTAAFMSPEQASGHGEAVGPASDIYGLGATLYVLLTSQAPFQGPVLEVLLQVQHGAIPPLRQRNKNVPPALEAICLKAMALRPQERYATAQELATDLEHWLADEPVTAYREPWPARLRRWGRRHRPLVAGAAALVLTAVAALTLGLVAVRREQQRTAQAYAAEKQAKETTEAINRFLTEDLLAVAVPENQGREVTIRQALDTAVPRISKAFAGQPEVEASVRGTIGATYLRLGLYPQAETHLHRALDINRELFGADHRDTLKAVGNVVALLVAQGKLSDAEALARRNLDDCQRVLGSDDADTLGVAHNLASVLRYTGKWAEAEELTRRNIELFPRVKGPDHPETLAPANLLAVLFFDQRKLAEAETLFRQNLENERRILGAEHPTTLTTLNNLATVVSNQGKPAEAEKLHRQNVEVRRRVFGPTHQETLIAMHNLAKTLQGQGKLAEAAPLYREILELKRQTLRKDHPSIANTLVLLGEVLIATGKAREAEALLIEGVEIRRKTYPPKHGLTASAEKVLGWCLVSQGRYAEAEPLLLTSNEILRHASGVPPGVLRSSFYYLIQMYEGWGKPEKAAAWRAERDKVFPPVKRPSKQ